MIAALELAHKGALLPDTVELLVLFAPRMTEVVKVDAVKKNVTSVDVSAWFSEKVFNGHWEIDATELSGPDALKRNIDKVLEQGAFKVSQAMKDYLKALSQKAGLVDKPSSIITLN